MLANYYFTLTDYGSSLVAKAHDHRSITLINLVLGDANDLPYNPIDNKHRSTLINQKASVPVQSVTAIDQICQVIATIESHIGGFNIHELGLTDSTGKLVYIGNYHGGYKPILTEGAFGEIELIIDIQAESGSQVLIEVSPNSVTANKQWVVDHFVSKETFNAHLVENLQQHLDMMQRIEQLENAYPRFIDGGIVSGNSIVNVKHVDDLRDNKYIIQITPEDEHEAWTISRNSKSFNLNIWNHTGVEKVNYSGRVNWSVTQLTADSIAGGDGHYYPGTYRITILPNETKEFILVSGGGAGGGSVWEDYPMNKGGDGELTGLYFNNIALVIIDGGHGGPVGQWSNGSYYHDGALGTIGDIVINNDLITQISQTSGILGGNTVSNRKGGISVSPIAEWGAGGNGAYGVGDEGHGFGTGGTSGGFVRAQYKNTSDSIQILNLNVGKGGVVAASNGKAGEKGIDGFAQVTTINP